MTLVERLKTALPRRAHRSLTDGRGMDVTKWSRRQFEDFWGDSRAQMVPQIRGAEHISAIPATFDWQRFMPGLKAVEEVIRQPLYSYKAYAAAGHTSLQLFDQTEGSATLLRADTNMKVAGALPGGEAQIVSAVKVVIFPAKADVQTAAAGAPPAIGEWLDVLYKGILEVSQSDKEYLVGSPLAMFPQGFGLGTVYGGAATVLLNLSLPNNGAPDNKATFVMDPPFGLRPTIPFKVLLRWGTAVTVTTAGRIGVILDGWKVRLVL
jgi:hypothetical protein